MIALKKIFLFFTVLIVFGVIKNIKSSSKELTQLYSNSKPVELYKDLKKNTDYFQKNICVFPTTDNLIENISGYDFDGDPYEQIGLDAQGVRPLMHEKVPEFLMKYLDHKKKNGIDLEKKLYENMSLSGFVYRLLHNRPLAYYGKMGSYLLKKDEYGKNVSGSKDFYERNITKCDGYYLLEDEINLATLLGISSYVNCIHNKSVENAVDYHIKRAVYIGSNMTLFEYDWKLGQWMHGNAVAVEDEIVRKIWLELLGTDPELSDKNYMKLIIEPFLIEANNRGYQACKKVYVNIPWRGLQEKELAQSFITACEDVFSYRSLPHIAMVNFSGLPDAESYMIAKKKEYCDTMQQIQPIELQNLCNDNKDVQFSCGPFYTDTFHHFHQDTCIFVTSYPLSSCAQPGNDYWCGNAMSLAAQMAAYSTLVQMHMADINPCIKEKIMGSKKLITCEESYNKQQQEMQAKGQEDKKEKQNKVDDAQQDDNVKLTEMAQTSKTEIKNEEKITPVDSKKSFWARVITCFKYGIIPVSVAVLCYLHYMYGFGVGLLYGY